MQTAKKEAQERLERLPEGSTFEDIQYHRYVLEKVHKGMERCQSSTHRPDQRSINIAQRITR